MTAVGVASATHFGQGHNEPFARALASGSGTLTLRPDGVHHAEAVDFDVRVWCEDASLLERSLLRTLQGPVLDVGCGPGRMLGAAQGIGLTALGIDTSADAVRRARRRGASAIEQSVFAPVPHSGLWQSVILLDGNIGIGGSITSLLRRCRELIAPEGILLAELDTDDSVDVVFSAVLEDENGNQSEPFRWARSGSVGLVSRARRSGWTVTTIERVQGRVFCRLSPIPAADGHVE